MAEGRCGGTISTGALPGREEATTAPPDHMIAPSSGWDALSCWNFVGVEVADVYIRWLSCILLPSLHKRGAFSEQQSSAPSPAAEDG